MNKKTEEKVKKEAEQIGTDVVIFWTIIALVGAVCVGIVAYF